MSVFTIDQKRFSGITEKLYTDYESVRPFYPYDYNEPSHWQNRIKWLDEHPGADSGRVCEALAELNGRLGAGEATMANIQKLSEGRCLAVVTGQQTGLFTGPLYTLYKAVTVIKQARSLSEETGRSVVPVFWMAAEDHDYAEIAMNWHFDGKQIKRVRLSRQHKSNVPVGGLPVTEELSRLCREVCEDCGLELYGKEMGVLLDGTLKESDTLGDWFGRLMLALFASWGLVVLDPSSAAMRAVMKPFLQHVLECLPEIQDAYITRTNEVVSHGYIPEVTMGDRQTGLFLIESGERIPLFVDRDGVRFSDRNERRHWTLEELLGRLDTSPADFSTGVVLRPVLQDWLLPVAAAVLGPSEAAYHGQLGSVFSVLGRQLPVIVPRESWVLALGSDPELLTPIRSLLNGTPEQWISKQMMDAADSSLQQRIHDYQQQTAEAFSALAKTLPISDEARITLTEHAHRTQERETERMMRTIRRELSTESERSEAYRILARMLRPMGKVQERTLLPWYFLSRMGPGLLADLTNLPFSSALRLYTGGKIR